MTLPTLPLAPVPLKACFVLREIRSQSERQIVFVFFWLLKLSNVCFSGDWGGCVCDSPL